MSVLVYRIAYGPLIRTARTEIILANVYREKRGGKRWYSNEIQDQSDGDKCQTYQAQYMYR